MNVLSGEDKTGASCRLIGAAMLSGLKSISIRKWILFISGIFTLAVVVVLKLDEYSRQYHPMFSVSPQLLSLSSFH